MSAIEYVKESKICTITLNRPQSLNAINGQLAAELSQALTDFRNDYDLWVGIITGTGDRAFCVGADIKEIGQVLGHQSPTTTEKYTKVDIGALRKIAQPWPGGRL